MSTLLSAEGGRFAPEIAPLKVDTMLRIHGYKQPEKVRKDIREIADKVCIEASTLFEPIVFHRNIRIAACSGDVITLDDSKIRFHNSIFGKILGNCTHVVTFLLTLGRQPDDAATALLQKDELLEAVFLETACWLGIEKATRSFTSVLRDAAKKEAYGITRRLAPGYGDWDLSEQELFFEIFSNQNISITLLESNCMSPKMSRSGMFGLRPI